MDVSTILLAGLFGLALAGATFGACHWHFGRRLRAAQARIEKLEQARQTSTQHVLQARKQIEGLQKELAAYREGRPVASATSGGRDRAAMEAALNQEEARHAAAREPKPLPVDGFAVTQVEAPPAPGNGFADTLPMSVRPRNLV